MSKCLECGHDSNPGGQKVGPSSFHNAVVERTRQRVLRQVREELFGRERSSRPPCDAEAWLEVFDEMFHEEGSKFEVRDE